MTPTAGPEVTAVVVTYDGAHLLPGCLDSLAAQTVGPDRLHVVVVDNASHDDTLELLRRDYPWVEVIASETNLGFAGGNDLALAQLRTPYAFLLNSDARAEPDCVATLLEAASAPGNERCAAFNATVLLMQRYRPAGPGDDAGRVLVAPAGRLVPDDDGPVRLVNTTGNQVTTDGYGTDRGWLEDAALHRPPADVFGFCGAAALLRREALDEVGPFDASFFMYYEDTDLSWRLRRAGWGVRHVPAARVDHIHAATSVEGSPLFLLHNDRNRLLMLTVNATAGFALRCVARALLTAASTTVRRREPWARTALRWRALGSWARLLPGALRTRIRTGRDEVVPREQVQRLLVPPVPAQV
jgi:GT2 family glycosyltransferase